MKRLAASNSCLLGLPSMMNCNLELWAKINTFFPKLFLSGYFFNHRNKEKKLRQMIKHGRLY